MDEREQAEACYRRMYEGMVAKDENVLREALAPSFALTHMTGMRQPREAFIQSVLDGTLNYRSVKHQGIAVQLHDGHAELTGQTLVRAAVFGGGWRTWRLQLRCRAIREDGKWQISEAKASTY